MTKKELIEAIASKTGDTFSSTAKMFNALTITMIKELSMGNEITVNNLGMFKPTVRAAYTGRNPKTGEATAIPERRVVNFKMSAVLKRALNE